MKREHEPGFVNRKAEEAIRDNMEVQLKATDRAARKRRIEVTNEMSRAVMEVERWYEPLLSDLNKRAVSVGQPSKGAFSDRFGHVLREEWAELHREKNKRLNVIEARYMADLKANDKWHEAESDRIRTEAEELLESLREKAAENS